MAITIYSTRYTESTSLGQRWIGLRANLTARFAQYRTYRSTLAELGMLTDCELADLGIHRSSIGEIAREAAFGV